MDTTTIQNIVIEFKLVIFFVNINTPIKIASIPQDIAPILESFAEILMPIALLGNPSIANLLNILVTALGVQFNIVITVAKNIKTTFSIFIAAFLVMFFPPLTIIWMLHWYYFNCVVFYKGLVFILELLRVNQMGRCRFPLSP